MPAAFDRELQRVIAEAPGRTTEQLRSVRSAKTQTLAGRSDKRASGSLPRHRPKQFVGNLESALDLHRRLGSDSELVEHRLCAWKELEQRQLEAEIAAETEQTPKHASLPGPPRHQQQRGPAP